MDDDDFISSIRLLARVVEDELTEEDMQMPAGLLQAVAVDYLLRAGRAEEASWLVPFDHTTCQLKEEQRFLTFCKNVLNLVIENA